MACLIAPYIDGKKSKLYQDLLDKTKNNRVLTNYLYAVSLALRNEITEKDLNDLKEMKSEVFFKRIQIDKLLSKQEKIIDLAKENGFYDLSGEPRTFLNPDSILDDVIQFNDNNPEFIAEIEYTKDGYKVVVNLKNAENYATNTSLKARDAQWLVLLNSLLAARFNIDFSDNSDYFNSFNVYRVRGVVLRLIDNKSRLKNVGERMASFILEVMKDSANYARAKNMFGDNLLNALITYTYIDSTIKQRESTIYEFPEGELGNNLRKAIARLLNEFKTKLDNISKNDLFDAMDRENMSVYSENFDADNLGVGEKTVRQTLKELYEEHHLDLDLLATPNKKLERISQVAKEMQRINAINLNLRKQKGDIDLSTLDKSLNILLKKILNGRYFESISTYLTVLSNLFEELIKDLKLCMKQMEELESGKFDLDLINHAASVLTQLTDLHNSNIDVILTLTVEDLFTKELELEDDDSLSSEKIKQDVIDVANLLKLTFDRFDKKNKKDIGIKLIYAFLKEKWGSDTPLTTSLIESNMVDISVLDRYINSIHDCPNLLVSTFGRWILETSRRRDDRLRLIRTHINRLDNKLNGKTLFMFVMNKNGIPTGKIISPYDYTKYYKDRSDYKDKLDKQKLSRSEFRKKLQEWENEHTTVIKLGSDLWEQYGINIYGDEAFETENSEHLPSIRVPFYDDGNGNNVYASKDLNSLSSELFEYYKEMAKLKATFVELIPEMAGNFYDAVLLSSDMLNSIKNAGLNPGKFAKQMKQKIGDIFKLRVDDTEYGGIATVNGIRQDLVDSNGNIVYRLPLFFTHKLEDRSRMSTDYSRGMLAMASSVVNYDEFSKLFDILQITKNYIVNKDVAKTIGQEVAGSVFKYAKETVGINVAKESGESRTAGFMNDFWEANVIGRRKKAFVLGGVNIDKIADSLTRYTSVVGLSANALGAQANLLVGKVLMLIECGFGWKGGGEFMNMKDYRKAVLQYTKYMMPCLAEIASNNKKSTMGVMMDFFDVSSDFYDKLKEQGYHSSMIAKILGNSSLFMLYGGGEHMLHAQTMFAILNHKKVTDPNGKEVPLFLALEVKVEEGNGELVVKDGYTYEDKPIDLYESGGIIEKCRDEIKYCNDSMHGAFSGLDKGMIHRLFLGRMLMNFRQWMPAHYMRRFGKRRYNSILKEDREGFYVSTAKFIWQLAKDARHAKFQWVARFKDLSRMEKYNIQRTASEALILMINYALIILAGDYKDHKNNWARRNLIYQLRRIDLELGATSFIPLAPSKWFSDNESYGGKSFLSPLKNTVTILNQPFACLNTFNTVEDLFAFSKLFETYESGKYEGENIYMHRLEKDIPLYGKIRQLFVDMLEEGTMFEYMNQ